MYAYANTHIYITNRKDYQHPSARAAARQVQNGATLYTRTYILTHAHQINRIQVLEQQLGECEVARDEALLHGASIKKVFVYAN